MPINRLYTGVDNSFPDQGCDITGCSYTFGGFDGDYENVNGEGEKAGTVKAGAKQAPSTGKMRYERFAISFNFLCRIFKI